MKKITVVLFLALLTFVLKAQDPTFSKGDLVLNASIGLGSTLYSGSNYSSGFPAIALSLEKGIEENFLADKLTLGVGGYLGYASYKYRYTYFGSEWGFNYNNIILGARGVVHYPLLDKLDTYAGLMLGVNIVSATEFGTNTYGYDYTSNGSRGIFSGYIGGRYYLNEKLAVLGEIGYGIAYLNLGISLKL